jgi:hypothetical protein
MSPIVPLLGHHGILSDSSFINHPTIRRYMSHKPIIIPTINIHVKETQHTTCVRFVNT